MIKAVYDKSVPTRNLVTTITGVIGVVITLLVAFGVIKPEMQAEVQSHTTNIIMAVGTIYGAIQSLILIFKAKD